MTYTEWLDRAMSLAYEYADQFHELALLAEDDPTRPDELRHRDAARAALAEHLRDVPMGEPVAWRVLDGTS